MDQTEFELAFTSALERFDPEAITAALAPDVVIQVAVHDEPMQGADVARFLFGVLSEEFVGTRVIEETVAGTRAFVLFSTTVGGVAAEGLLRLELGAEKVEQLTVFLRPLAALQQVSDRVGRRMAERFGELPPDS